MTHESSEKLAKALETLEGFTGALSEAIKQVREELGAPPEEGLEESIDELQGELEEIGNYADEVDHNLNDVDEAVDNVRERLERLQRKVSDTNDALEQLRPIGKRE